MPVFWPGKFHGLYNPWGCKESDTTEQLSLPFLFPQIHVVHYNSKYNSYEEAQQEPDGLAVLAALVEVG